MAEKHTPGPWRRNGSLIEGPRIGLVVAEVWGPEQAGAASQSEEALVANARLCAAAPDLADALVAIMRKVKVGEPVSLTLEEINDANYALFKAFGRSFAPVAKAEGR